MPKNIDYLPKNYISKYYTKEQAYSKVLAESPDGEKDLQSINVKDVKEIEIDNETKYVSSSLKSKMKISKFEAKSKNNTFKESETIEQEIAFNSKLRTSLSPSSNEIYIKKGVIQKTPSLVTDLFDVENKHVAEGFTEDVKNSTGYEKAIPTVDVKVDDKSNDIKKVKIDSSFIKINTEFKAVAGNDYIKSKDLLVLIGSSEYNEKYKKNSRTTNKGRGTSIENSQQVKLEKVVDIIVSGEERHLDLKSMQKEIFLYGLFPYMVTSAFQQTSQTIKTLMSGDGGATAIAAASVDVASRAFAKLEDAKYYTVLEFARLATISFVLHQAKMPRGITIKKLTKNFLGYDTEEFNGKIDLLFGLNGKNLDKVWKEQTDFMEWANQRSYGLFDKEHVQIIKLKDTNAIIYSGGEAGENRLFKPDRYQPIHYETSNSPKSMHQRFFSTYEPTTLVKDDFKEIDSIGSKGKIVSIFSLSESQNSPDYLRYQNKGNVLSEVTRNSAGNAATSKAINIKTLGIRKKMFDVDNKLFEGKSVKGGLYSVGYVRVMPFTKTYDGFDIPFQFNPIVSEGGVQAKYASMSFVARVGDLQTYINTSSLNSVSLTTSYTVLTDGGTSSNDIFDDGWENNYNYRLISTIENMYRSLVYPAFKENSSTSEKSFEYAKPPIVRIRIGGDLSNLLVYPKKIKESSSGEDNSFRNFIVTGVTINKDIQNVPLMLVKEEIVDSIGFEVQMSLIEVSRNYIDALPDFRDYYSTFSSIIGKFQSKDNGNVELGNSGIKNIEDKMRDFVKTRDDTTAINNRKIYAQIKNGNYKKDDGAHSFEKNSDKTVYIDDSGKVVNNANKKASTTTSSSLPDAEFEPRRRGGAQ